MKKFLLLIAVAFSVSVQAQDCGNIFFSEYVEGFGNAKALEIYNPTAETVDLSNYSIFRYSNGSNAPDEELELEGMLASGEVWVVSNGQADTVALDGGGISPPNDPALQAISDQLDALYPAPTYFNGNDAITLEVRGSSHNTAEEFLDIIGKIGEDPGSDGWVNEASDISTKNTALIRNPNVLAGTGFTSAAFDPAAEFNGFDGDVISNLGRHQCDCTPISCTAPTLDFYTWCVDVDNFEVRMATLIPVAGDFTFTITDNQGSDPAAWDPQGDPGSYGYYAVDGGTTVIYVTNDQTGDCAISSVTLDRNFSDCSFLDTVGMGLAVNDIAENRVASYPNPAQDVLHIESLDQMESIAFYDISGKLVLQVSAPSKNTTLDLSEVQEGMYLMIVELEDGRSVTDRIIIE